MIWCPPWCAESAVHIHDLWESIMGTYRTTKHGYVSGRVTSSYADVQVNGVRIYSTWTQR